MAHVSGVGGPDGVDAMEAAHADWVGAATDADAADAANASAGGSRAAGVGHDGVEESAAAKAAFDPARDLSKQVQMELLALMEVTREEVHVDEAPARKRRRVASGATAEREFTYSTTSTAIRALYENLADWQRAVPAVERRKGWRAGRFNSFRLRAVEHFALKSGGAGLSLQWLEELFDLLDTWDGTKPGMPIDDHHNQPIRQAFNSRNAFKDAVRDDVDDAVLNAGWMKCTLVVDGERFVALFRPVLEVVLGMLRAGKKVQLWSGENGPALPTDKRESPLDGDAFRLNEAAVMAEKKDPSCFILGLHVYSDASQLSWSGGTEGDSCEEGESMTCCCRGSMDVELVLSCAGALKKLLTHSCSFSTRVLQIMVCLAAHKLYPLRVRVVNVITGDVEWEPIAYIPVVRKQKEPSAEVRARARRHSILQRVLYMAFRTAIAASRKGVKHEMGGKTYVAFPRILLYLCDQPEEKAVLCIKGGNCKYPCSSCLVPAELSGDPAALEAVERSAVETLKRQVESEAHERFQRQPQRRADLEAEDSAHSRLPALAGMFGLSSEPFLLYKIIGFDCLHVRFLVSFARLIVSSCVSFVFRFSELV